MYRFHRHIAIYFISVPVLFLLFSYRLSQIGINFKSYPSLVIPIRLGIMIHYAITIWVFFVKKGFLLSKFKQRPKPESPPPEFLLYLVGLSVFIAPALGGFLLIIIGSSFFEMLILSFVSILTELLWVKHSYPGDLGEA